MARWLRYDLRAGSLEEAVHGFLPGVRRMPLTRDHTCRECDLLLLCQNCPAWAYHQVGDPEAAEPFRCQLTHLRHHELGLAIHFVKDNSPPYQP
jgi:sulfatase maturation enzyme AslB (radical SAM superfamily)